MKNNVLSIAGFIFIGLGLFVAALWIYLYETSQGFDDMAKALNPNSIIEFGSLAYILGAVSVISILFGAFLLLKFKKNTPK
jgi:hypothetical protein